MTLRLVSFFTIKIREFLKAICLNQEPTPNPEEGIHPI